MFRDKATRKSHKLARALVRAAVSERAHIGRGPRYLVHPNITAACAPSLRAIAAALRDNPTAFGDDELRAVQSFILDGESPFFGRDSTAAMRESVRLQHAVVVAQPTLGREQVKQADGNVRQPSPALTGS